MRLDRRTFLAASAAAAAAPASARTQSSRTFVPEDFGARGDGTTNDTRAFAELSAAVNRNGGGTISLRSGRTYLVGAQTQGPGQFGWSPSPIIALEKLTAPLAILGNGARLRCQPGLRVGTFDLASGERVDHPMPYTRRNDLAVPYRAMLLVQHCLGSVTIRDLELDGNSGALRIGGRYGDKGWQVPATGLLLVFNRGAEVVDNVHSHHQALDGAMIIGDPDRTGARSRISKFVAQFNGRQGVSVTAGRGYDFADCEFSHTGRGPIASAPGAGVDIEAERQRTIRDLTFTRCSFVDNNGAGLVAESGDSADVRFTDCRFVGTSNWSAWPRKPGYVFAGCTFVGAMVNAFADPDPARATKFIGCTFTDDPALSPTGKVYVRKGPIAMLTKSDNVLFDRCKFALVAEGTLPATTSAIYRDCTMRQRSQERSSPRGRYLGTTSIAGPADLAGSAVEGSLTLNGKPLPRGIIGGVRPR